MFIKILNTSTVSDSHHTDINMKINYILLINQIIPANDRV